MVFVSRVYQKLTQEETAMDISTSAQDHSDSGDEHIETTSKLSNVKDDSDLIISFIGLTSNVAKEPYCEHLKAVSAKSIFHEEQGYNQKNPS